jgi:hypothetical protein
MPMFEQSIEINAEPAALFDLAQDYGSRLEQYVSPNSMFRPSARESLFAAAAGLTRHTVPAVSLNGIGARRTA